MFLKDSVQEEFNELEKNYYQGKTVFVHANMVMHWAIAQLLNISDIHEECIESIREQLPRISNSVEFGKAILNYYTIEQTDYAAALRDTQRGDIELDVKRYPVELVRDTLDAVVCLLENSQGEGIKVSPNYLRTGVTFFETILVRSAREAAESIGWKPFYQFNKGNGVGLEGRIAIDISTRLQAARTRADLWTQKQGNTRSFALAV